MGESSGKRNVKIISFKIVKHIKEEANLWMNLLYCTACLSEKVIIFLISMIFVCDCCKKSTAICVCLLSRGANWKFSEQHHKLMKSFPFSIPSISIIHRTFECSTITFFWFAIQSRWECDRPNSLTFMDKTV